jgi:tetratricopeptide (TPR) repeat protein
MVSADSRARPLINEYLVECYRRLNQPDRIASLGLNMDNAQARFNQADAYVRQGKPKDAVTIYEDLLKNEDSLTPEGRQTIFSRLMSTLVQIERAKPVAERNWTQVDRMADEILRRSNLRDAAAAQFEIEMLMNKDQLSEARKKAEEAVTRYPRHASFRLLLAQLTNDPVQALRILDQLEQAVGDSVVLRLTRADQIVKTGGTDVADRIQALEQNTESFSADDRNNLLQGLAGVYRRIGLPQEAIRVWRDVLTRNEKNLGIRVAIFDLAFEADDLPTMEEMLAQIAALDGRDSSEWQVAEARRLLWLARRGEADPGKLQEILDLLGRAQAARPEFAPIYAVQAEVQLLQNKPEEAIESLRSALQRRPGEIAYLQRLSDVLMALNRVEEARPILAQLPEQQKRTSDVIADIQLLLRQDPEKALERGQQLFPPTSDSVDVLMNLVEIYQAANKLTDAIPIMQRATQLDPAQPRPWRTLVRALVSAGRRDEAQAAIEQIKTHVPAEHQAMTLGQCYATLGAYDMAEQAYAQAAQREPNNTVLMRNQALLFLSTQQQEKLRATLNRLIAVNAGDDRQLQADVAWGRRLLAQQLARDGSYQDFRNALELLNKNAGDGGELTGEDLSLWLLLCANRPETDSRRMAVDRLNQLRNQRSLTSGENAVLAYVYHAEGQWPEAQRLMVDILSKNPDNASYLTTYIEWLLERQEFADAAVWVRKLAPTSTPAIRFTSILLTQQGKPQDAAKHLLSFVPKQIDEVEATRMMEELGKYNEGFFKLAQRQWKSLVQKNPQLIHSYIDFLSRMPKAAGVEEALQLAEQQMQRAVSDKRPEVAEFYLDVGIKALRANRKTLPADSPYFDRVKGWFELGRQAQLTDLQLAWHEVDFLDARRDYAQLTAAYESLLKRTDISDLQRAVIRNNLAYVYAISNKGSQALAVIGDAIDQLGPRSDFLDTRGLAYLADRQFENAVKDLRSAVSGGQGGAATYFHLALAEHSSGNIAEATAAIRQAQQLGLDEADLSSPEVALYRRLMRELEPHLKDNKLSQTK